MTEQQKPVLAVVGPTASGKTALGVQLAKYYQGEVVSADSMQIYQGLDLATAKPTEEEMQGVPHHLISQIPRADHCTGSCSWTSANFGGRNWPVCFLFAG